MLVTTVLITLVSILIIKWYRDRKYKQEIFKRMGLRGPTPSLFMGNLGEVAAKGFKYALKDWTEKYGKMFGYFEGEDPIMVVGDTHIAKQIVIKEFHKFHSHRRLPTNEYNHEKRTIFDAEGDRWKRLRSITSPTFTSKRMKEMSPLINKSVDDLLVLFGQKCDEGRPFDVCREFGRLTIDVISSCGFGIDAGALRDEESPFLVQAKKAFDDFENPPLRIKIAVPLCILFPGLTMFLRKWTVIDELLSLAPYWTVKMGHKVLQDRKQNPHLSNERVDILKLLLEGKKPGVQEEADELLSYPGSDRNESFKPLNDEEIVAQMAIVMLAGYETTSSALAFTAYQLSLNPHIQEKLQAEIDQYFPEKNVKPDYTTVHKLPYLEAVMKETLRIHPIGTLAMNRKCFEETKIGDLTIPKGMNVQINMDALHFQADLWGKYDPTEFVPERFLEDCQDAHNNMIWVPFGAGPRICLGMRFAQMEFKTALVRTLKAFSFKKCDKTQIPLPTKKNGIHGPSEGVYVTLERR